MSEPGRDGLLLRLAAYGAALDAEIRNSGALDRVRSNVLQRRSGYFLADIPWRRVAAAIVVAGMLGGAVDLAFPRQSVDSFDVAIIDPLFAVDAADTQ